MGLLDMVVGDAVADPDAHSASVFGMVAIHPPLLGFAPHVVEDDIDAVRIDEVGFHGKKRMSRFGFSCFKSLDQTR